jgi:hypothetical protein
MTPADLERVHKEILGFERIEAVSDEMRALIEERSWCTSCRRSGANWVLDCALRGPFQACDLRQDRSNRSNSHKVAPGPMI